MCNASENWWFNLKTCQQATVILGAILEKKKEAKINDHFGQQEWFCHVKNTSNETGAFYRRI